MNKRNVIKQIISRIYKQLSDYHNDNETKEFVGMVVFKILSADNGLEIYKEKIDKIIPSPDDDGRIECSYAMNSGLIILCYIDYLSSNDDTNYDNAVQLFNDNYDFKSQEYLESIGINQPTEFQIQNTEIYKNESNWLISISQ